MRFVLLFAACAPIDQLVIEARSDIDAVRELRVGARSGDRFEEQTFPIAAGETISFGVVAPAGDTSAPIDIELEARSATASLHREGLHLDRLVIGRGFVFLADVCRRAPIDCGFALVCGPCGSCDPFSGEEPPPSWSRCDEAVDAGEMDGSPDAAEPDADHTEDADSKTEDSATDAGVADREPSDDDDDDFDGSVPDRGPPLDASPLSAGRDGAQPRPDAGPEDVGIDLNGRTFGDAESRDSEAYDGALDDGRDT